MKLSYDLNQAKEFELIPVSVQTASIAKAEYGLSKSKQQPMFTLTWKIEGGDHAGKEIRYDTMSLSPQAAEMCDNFLNGIRFPRLCKGCGTSFDQSVKIDKVSACPNCQAKGMAEWDAGDPPGVLLLGRRCLVKVTQEPSQKDPTKSYNRIDGYFPLSA